MQIEAPNGLWLSGKPAGRLGCAQIRDLTTCPVASLRNRADLQNPLFAEPAAELMNAVIFPIVGDLMLFAVACMPARAAPPPTADPTGPLHTWFERQYAVNGAWCCNVSDGHMLADEDWRPQGDHYQVRIGGLWYLVPDSALRDPRGGPNPTGAAVIWYTMGALSGVRIYCFAPGTLY